MGYTAFMSYSHAADGKLAPALQSALHQFAKPWYRLRAVSVFRDKTSLSANPGLWSSIEKALNESQYFILMASPEAAASQWVQKEIQTWVQLGRLKTVLIVLTGGSVQWNSAAGDFDWDSTTALPDLLKATFTEQPLYVDLKWARTEEQLSSRDPRFREAVASIASALRRIPMDELIGEDVRLHQRATRLANGAVASLALFAIGAGLAAYYATQQKEAAKRQRDEALRAQSLYLADLSNQQTMAGEARYGILLALEGLPTDPNKPGRPLVPQTEAALYRSLASSRQLTAFEGHKDSVIHATFAPDGSTIVTSSLDGTVKLWDAETGKYISTLREEQNELDAVRHIAYSADGTKMVASSFRHSRLTETSTGKQLGYLSGDRTYSDRILKSSFSNSAETIITTCVEMVRLWNAETGRELEVLANKDAGTLRAVDRNLSRLLTTSKDQRAHLWDLQKGVELAVLGNEKYLVSHATFRPDAKRLATYNASEGGKLRIWDADTGAHVAVIEGHDGVVSAYFSPTGSRLVTHGWGKSGLSYHDLPRLWSGDGEPIKSLQGHEGSISYVAFSPDGKLFATASKDGTVKIWNSFDGTEVAVLRGHHAEILHLEFSSDSSYFISTSIDHTARLWRVRDANLLAKLPAMQNIYDYGDLNTAAGRLITGYRDGTVALWDTKSWTIISTVHAHKNGILRTAWSSDNTRFATAGQEGTVRIWDAKNGIQSVVLEGHSGFVRSVTFTDDDRKIISTGDDGTARIWDIEDSSHVVFNAEEEGVADAFLLKDQRRLVTTSSGFVKRDKTIKVWDTSNRTLLKTFHGPLCLTTLKPDMNVLLASISNNGVLMVSDVDEGREVSRLDGMFVGDEANVTACAFSPDGKQVGLGFVTGTARVWEVRSGFLVRTLRGHAGPRRFGGQIQHISFSPDGKYVATGSVDKTARLSEVKSGLELGVFGGHEDWVTNVVFGPDGKHLITMGGDVHLWGIEGQPIFSFPKAKLGFAFKADLFDNGRRLLVVDSREVSIYNMFPSNRIADFPTTSALVKFAETMSLAPLSQEERQRFFIAVKPEQTP
jgi:WD40 repeat protein